LGSYVLLLLQQDRLLDVASDLGSDYGRVVSVVVGVLMPGKIIKMEDGMERLAAADEVHF
jgi:hypothetical protein